MVQITKIKSGEGKWWEKDTPPNDSRGEAPKLMPMMERISNICSLSIASPRGLCQWFNQPKGEWGGWVITPGALCGTVWNG